MKKTGFCLWGKDTNNKKKRGIFIDPFQNYQSITSSSPIIFGMANDFEKKHSKQIYFIKNNPLD